MKSTRQVASAQSTVHQVVSRPAPSRGLNTTGEIAIMPPTDAVEMDNFISTDLGVQVRQGWRQFATGLPGVVRTVLSYDGATTQSTISPIVRSQLFAATDTGIFDIEGGGDMSAEEPLIALSGASEAGYMTMVQYTTDAGQFLIACSETDGAFLYDGAAWMKMSSTGGPGPGFITGADPSTFVQVCAWKKRLMFVQRGTTIAWILGPGLVGGAAEFFDFGPLFRFGGSLLALINWTMDAGDGIDDRLVVIGSSGDLVIYAGTDPTDATQFENVGTWFIGQPPVGRRFFTSSGGNIFVLTSFGVVPVAQIVQGGLDSLQLSGTEYFQQLGKIQTALNQDFSQSLNLVGWEIMYMPTRALLHIARPSLSSNEFVQYGYQEHNMAWCRLLDIPGITFYRRLDEVYAGTSDGKVLRVHDGYSDGMLLDGSGDHEIRGRITPAFDYFGNPSVLKQALMARVIFLGPTPPGYIVTINADFAIKTSGEVPGVGRYWGSLWDEAQWDDGFWAGARMSFSEWRCVEAIGYALTPTVYVASEQPTTIVSIEHMVKAGGPL